MSLKTCPQCGYKGNEDRCPTDGCPLVYLTRRLRIRADRYSAFGYAAGLVNGEVAAQVGLRIATAATLMDDVQDPYEAVVTSRMAPEFLPVPLTGISAGGSVPSGARLVGKPPSNVSILTSVVSPAPAPRPPAHDPARSVWFWPLIGLAFAVAAAAVVVVVFRAQLFGDSKPDAAGGSASGAVVAPRGPADGGAGQRPVAVAAADTALPQPAPAPDAGPAAGAPRPGDVQGAGSAAGTGEITEIGPVEPDAGGPAKPDTVTPPQPADVRGPAPADAFVVSRASMLVITEPPGADVYVDGQLRGVSPLSLDGERGRTVRLMLKKTRFRTFQARVTFGAMAEAQFSLKAASKRSPQFEVIED